MKRFLIYVTDLWDKNLDSEKTLVLSKADYSEFIRLTREADAYNDFSKGISVKCESCDSFITDISSLYCAVAKVIRRIDSDLDFIHDVLHKIMKPVTLTDEELKKYQMGSIRLKPIDSWVDPIFDCDGFRFVTEECTFIFDRDCACNSVMQGE